MGHSVTASRWYCVKDPAEQHASTACRSWNAPREGGNMATGVVSTRRHSRPTDGNRKIGFGLLYTLFFWGCTIVLGRVEPPLPACQSRRGPDRALLLFTELDRGAIVNTYPISPTILASRRRRVCLPRATW